MPQLNRLGIIAKIVGILTWVKRPDRVRRVFGWVLRIFASEVNHGWGVILSHSIPSKVPKTAARRDRYAQDSELPATAPGHVRQMVVHGKQTVRITGGALRSRRLHFPAMPGLRPTPDRVRETLFNWLGQNLAGLRVLDLFAGSGILSIEALSRGAVWAVAIEQSARVVSEIRRNFEDLGIDATRVRVWQADALAWLRQASTQHLAELPIDLVFLDPPFAHPALLNNALLALNQADWLAADARVYVECSARGSPIDFPGWAIVREGRAGESRFMLWRRAVAQNDCLIQTES